MISILTTFRLLLCITTASAYIFEFTLQLKGPESGCNNRDVRMILHGVEKVLDDKCNEFLQYSGYTGFVDRMNLFIDDEKHVVVGDQFVLGPFYGDAECESCPSDDKDTLYFRRSNDRLSKKEVSAYIENELQQELAEVVRSRSSPRCAVHSDEWKATFRWL